MKLIVICFTEPRTIFRDEQWQRNCRVRLFLRRHVTSSLITLWWCHKWPQPFLSPQTPITFGDASPLESIPLITAGDSPNLALRSSCLSQPGQQMYTFKSLKVNLSKSRALAKPPVSVPSLGMILAFVDSMRHGRPPNNFLMAHVLLLHSTRKAYSSEQNFIAQLQCIVVHFLSSKIFKIRWKKALGLQRLLWIRVSLPISQNFANLFTRMHWRLDAWRLILMEQGLPDANRSIHGRRVVHKPLYNAILVSESRSCG